MKYIKSLLFALFLFPIAGYAATADFQIAAQVLAAAKNADIQQVQMLINNGADVNYVDATGLSLVCTALMNNDVRAAQILQMYGADASQCDKQIKQYNMKNKPKSTGGLFSGLSTAQSVTLAAAGAAVVVGGLFLLTDVFDPGNDNKGGAGSGDRPNNSENGGGGSGTGTAEKEFTIPYGPLTPNAESSALNYQDNLNTYGLTSYKPTYQAMSNSGYQNYLLLMHGYSPMARGYLGMRTLRTKTTHAPLDLNADSNMLGDKTPIMGGMPINVALVTKNGINAADDSSLGNSFLLWATVNNNATTVNGAVNTNLSSKYYNNDIKFGNDENTIEDDTVTEADAVAGVEFDLSGNGTAIHNTSASVTDNLLAKVVGGRGPGDYAEDFMGFMPNGQMTIFRTGGGEMISVSNTAKNGTYEMTGTELATNDKITLFNKTFTVTRTDNNVVLTPTEGTGTLQGAIDADGNLNLTDVTIGSSVVNQIYSFDEDNKLVLSKQNGIYRNYTALLNSAQLWRNGDTEQGRSRPLVIANTSVIAPLHADNAPTINTLLSYSDVQTKFWELIDNYYDPTGADSTSPSDNAKSFFGYGMWQRNNANAPMVLFSTGGYETNDTWSGDTLFATFENAVPLMSSGVNHMFMSIVAVGLTGGTSSFANKNVSDFETSRNKKFTLAQWKDSDEHYYKARACGVAGTGTGGVDPWCFASAGLTDELAVASAAGAVGVLRSAFDYMTPNQLFTLLALTADGPFLATNSAGTSYNEESLIAYLDAMYLLPNEFQRLVDNGAKTYLDAFKEVFGYGLINLERATTPGKSIYYYDGNKNKIVSADGKTNAYWRSATNTTFRSSSAFSPRASTISAAFFDKLESVDGTMALPRVWNYEFAIGGGDKRGLYMGDVLGDLKTRNVKPAHTQVGDFGFSMSMSQREYVDNMNGLDNLRLDFARGNWTVAAEYQRYFTDGMSRFDGMSNPVLGLASNVMDTDVQYKIGNWSFGARAFSGAITDEGLLESDPTISAQYLPARLGLMNGGDATVAWQNDSFTFATSVGTAHETNTILGAQTDGLLNLGGGDTTYVDATLRYAPVKDIALTLRSTFARTTSDATGEFIIGLSDVYSDSYAVGADIGNFSFTVARPLAVRRGHMQYSYADYDVVETADGKYDLNITNAHIADINLSPENREVRFTGTYRHNFGEFTDGALGFIYRVNPNNTKEFGNESIFMIKMTHRLGI